jgi:hypothetical protein
MSILWYHLAVGRKRRQDQSVRVEVHQLKGRRKGALIKEEVWYEKGQVSFFNLAYINLKISHTDHGRVLGFDNSHGYIHRHYLGKMEPVDLDSYEAVYRRFIQELHQLWRREDEEPEA